MKLLAAALLINVAAFAQSVGDISFDPDTDDPKFKVCNANWIWQGYQLKSNQDETPLMVAREFRAKFKPDDAWKNESGTIRIRFIVNCSGAADRFRLLGLDADLKEKQFSKELSDHVLAVAKSIPWPSRRAYNQTVDYYHHFSIRIVNGKLVDIIQ